MTMVEELNIAMVDMHKHIEMSTEGVVWVQATSYVPGIVHGITVHVVTNVVAVMTGSSSILSVDEMLSRLDAIVPDSGEITAGIRRGRNRDWNPAAIARRIPVAIVSEIWRDHGRIPAASRPNARLPGQQWGRSVGDGARGQLRGCRSAAGHEEARGWSRDTQLSCQIYPTMKIFTIVFSPQNSSIPISAYSTDLPPPLDRMVRPASQRDVATNRGDPGERCGRKKGQENDVGVTPSTGKGAAKRRLLRSRYLAVKNLISDW
ncbi:hypothetical protein ZIOFF_035588 [Zingiber officinale]|uniref:Uncharacterized protein n=1 Tax=Zingiber officinale TaxID=94328 RepID=A0A8J5L2S3_ZINOF|nr:hypothetical protein ZIOFF_035588 [Zingiber officinale]